LIKQGTNSTDEDLSKASVHHAFWYKAKFRSLCEFVEALRKQFGDMSRGI